MSVNRDTKPEVSMKIRKDIYDEMLNTLKVVLADLENGVWSDDIELLRDTITKAEGK